MSFNESAERVRARLHDRVLCYRTVFMGGRKHAAETPFKWWQVGFWIKPSGGNIGVEAAVVLRDLSHYCHANDVSRHVKTASGQFDPLALAFAEGQRDVFNRIIGLCSVTQDQIDRIANRGD